MSIAPTAPILVPFGHETVLLRSFGDEFYSRLETLDGYTVLTDLEGGITYASLKDGRFVSTDVSISEPPPQGLPRHLQEDMTGKHDVFVKNFLNIRGIDLTNPDFTLGTDKGLLEGRKRSLGDVRGLTIMVEFSDQSTSIRPAQVDDLLNKQGYSQGGHLGSVRDYYLTMSNNKLDYHNDVIGPVRLPNTRAYYSRNRLFDDAIKAAIEQEGLDLSKYATQQEGESTPVVDAINFLYAGESVFKDWLWPHNSVCERRFNGIKTGLYMLTGLGGKASSMSIGTICHETGHLLCRFPDLYDYGDSERDGDYGNSEGMGEYCLMSSGNHLEYGRIPAPVCGYLRKLAGWVDTEVEMKSGQKYELRHGDYGTIYLHRTTTLGEYFIIENRSRYGYDRSSPSNGLAVMHCDIYGSNEFQDGTPQKHYQCALLQADGRRNLERNHNRGDATDMFTPRGGVFLNANTVPNSRDWNGADSGLILHNLGMSGAVMSFSTGEAPVSQGTEVEGWPRVEIPDDDSNGISVTLELPPDTPANTVEVRVEILHSWRGDLTVELISPSGETVILQRGGEDDSVHDLVATWSSGSHSELARLTGASGAGIWTLKVIDTGQHDVGTLEYVRIACR